MVRISTDVALTFPFNPSKHMIVFEVTNGYNVSDFCTVTETKSTTLIPTTATKSAILELAKNTKSVILVVPTTATKSAILELAKDTKSVIY